MLPRRRSFVIALLALGALSGCVSKGIADEVWPKAWRWANRERIVLTFRAGESAKIHFEAVKDGGELETNIDTGGAPPESVAELVTASLADVDPLALAAPSSGSVGHAIAGSTALESAHAPESPAAPSVATLSPGEPEAKTLTTTARLAVEGSPEREAMLREAREGALGGGDTVVACYELQPPVRFPGDESMTTALIVATKDGEPYVLARGPLGWTRCDVVQAEHDQGNALKKATALLGTGGLVGFGVIVDVALGALAVGIFGGLIWLSLGAPGLH